MSKLKLSGKQIRALGYPEGPVVSVAMHTMGTHYKHLAEEAALQILSNILSAPADYATNETLGKIATLLIEKEEDINAEIALRKEGVPYNIFGAEFIEEGALQQMATASKLPVSVAGALMPDAHHGYGLPIGGVLATDNAIIPYAVGVDIGCRMCLSIFNISPEQLEKKASSFQRELVANTLFGAGRDFNTRETRAGATTHEVLERKEFTEIPFLRNLQGKAANQLGSSGSGNHFVEWGIVDINSAENAFAVPEGKYLGLLSHSGSRGLGAMIAANYTQLAKKKTLLPEEAKHLAWLDMDKEEGIEYWLAMNLAGDYASACHHTIHEKIADAIGERPMARIENHHNFAWKEIHEGKELIVHRKGATPAGKDVLGIIPGSMTAPGFIVKGKGQAASLNSASHGAGRKMSRTKALANISHEALKKELANHGVTLLGGGLDEAPFAYKDIHEVMKSQTQLVDVLGAFYPKIVQMDGTAAKTFRKKKRP
ncbi:MAG: 2,3-cyclic phosphate--5-hydroxyl ligase [Ferruginibacter sp.]|nr:2,3-cyclic phosphate--5-hydroxyl ligase [Ferruginibacter sp.]